MAVVVDVTKKVREATYIIESDGPISTMVVEVLESVQRYYATTYKELDFPNIRHYIEYAVEKKILPPKGVTAVAVGSGPAVPLPALAEILLAPAPDLPELPPVLSNEDIKTLWKEYCLKVSEPFMIYFEEKVMQHNCMDYWRAASMADPLNIQRQSVTASELRRLIAPLVGKLVPPALVDRMVSELSEYDRACGSQNWSDDTYEVRLGKVESFWASKKLLPGWREFAHLVFLLTPTSACVERAFSMLKLIMSDNQTCSLSDKIEASLMLRYNRAIKR